MRPVAVAALLCASCLASTTAPPKPNLVPLVLATRDLPSGTVLAFDDIAQRQVPEQFVTSSVVKPDSASYIVGQRLRVPLLTGDAMLWSMFEVTDKATSAACEHALPPEGAVWEQVARARAIVLAP